MKIELKNVEDYEFYFRKHFTQHKFFLQAWGAWRLIARKTKSLRSTKEQLDAQSIPM